MFPQVFNFLPSFHDRQYSSGSKYITLTSDSGNEEQVTNRNTNTDFICNFNEPFYFHHNTFEVGLVGIKFQLPPSPEYTIQSVKKLPDKLFPNIMPSIKNVIPCKKKKTKIPDFISQFNDIMNNANLKLVLTFGIINTNEYFITLHYSDSNVNKYVILPHNLTTVLGYTREWFLPGTFDSYELFTQEAFDRLPKESNFDVYTEKFQNDENLISIEKIYERTFHLKRSNVKGDTDFRQFFSRINERLEKAGIQFGFLMSVQSSKISLAFDAKEDEYVVIPAKISQMLGFAQDKFFKGVHRSGFDLSMEAFNSIADKENFYFRFGTFLTNQIPMEEPTPNLQPTNVIQTLNKAFKDRLYPDTKISFELLDGNLVMKGSINTLHVKLPKLLCNYFGISQDILFKNNISIPVSEEIKNLEKQIEEEKDYIESGEDEITPSPKIKPGTRILVLCDAVENQYFNSRAFPMLRDIDMPASKDYLKPVQLDFSPVVYVMLKREHIQQLRISLVDEYGRPLIFGDKQTVVKLHFKPIFEQ